MGTLAIWLPITINVCIFGAVILAGVFVFKRSVANSLAEVQERVIAALREENQTQEDQIKRLRTELSTLQAAMATLRVALRRRGIIIKVHEDYVTLTDSSAPNETVIRIRRDSDDMTDEEGGTPLKQ